MTPPPQERTAAVAWELAPEVYCLGPRGRTQTNIYFVRAGSSWTLIDTGWPKDGPAIQQAAESLFGADTPPASILLTHSHLDHDGAALQLARRWNCPVFVHPQELPLVIGDLAAITGSGGPLDIWLLFPLMRAMGRRRWEATLAKSSLKEVARVLDLDAGVPGLGGWRCVPTPGHTPGHVSFFRSSDRVLITGDAVVTMRMNSGAGAAARAAGPVGAAVVYDLELACGQAVGGRPGPAGAQRAGGRPRQAHDRPRYGGGVAWFCRSALGSRRHRGTPRRVTAPARTAGTRMTCKASSGKVTSRM